MCEHSYLTGEGCGGDSFPVKQKARQLAEKGEKRLWMLEARGKAGEIAIGEKWEREQTRVDI